MQAKRYAGGDISLLPLYEDAGAKYNTTAGKPIADLLPYLYDEGLNAMRVRVFVNPDDYHGADKDPNACQTIDNVIPLCKRIKEAGFDLMIDFHYSDTWADPGQQTTPAQWKDLTDTQLCQAVYDYTAESLRKLKDADVTPDFIQTGNEISFGMLWGGEGTPEANLKKTFLGSDANWQRLGNLLSNAIAACREVCPDAGIVLHTERTSDIPVQDNFYARMERMNIDYDIIGLSYYPYFHGPLSSLCAAISSLENKFPTKKIMIVETGYSYKWEVPGTNQPVDYPYSATGQKRFMEDLVALLEQHDKVEGLFWWWLEYNAYGTNLSGWYNAPLFDSTNGRALPALKVLASFADSSDGVEEVEISTPASQQGVMYRIDGTPAPVDARGLLINSTDRTLVIKP